MARFGSSVMTVLGYYSTREAPWWRGRVRGGGKQRTGGGVRGCAHRHGEGQRRLASGVGCAHVDVLLLEQQLHLQPWWS